MGKGFYAYPEVSGEGKHEKKPRNTTPKKMRTSSRSFGTKYLQII